MTDHDHDHGSPKGCHGIPIPPPDEELARYETTGVRAASSYPLHFFARGPKDVRSIPKRYIRRRDGGAFTCTYEFRWFLDRVEGTTRAKAITRLYDVLLAPNSWSRAGVHWKRVMDRAQADIIVRVIPQDATVCGPGSAGCYSWGYEADGKPVAEIGVEHIDRPGPWASLVNMELIGHGTFRADDQYLAVHQPYVGGVMGTWADMARASFYPTDQEVEDSKTWLKGETPPDRIHRH